MAAALSLCALAFPVSIAAGNIALGALGAALLHRGLREGGRIRSAWAAEPALWALFAYAAVGLLAAAASETPAESLKAAAKDLHRPLALLLFVGAIALEPAAPILESFGISLGAMAAWGSLQSLQATFGGGLFVRAHGFVHPVVFGEMMGLASLGGLSLMLRPGQRDSKGRALAAAYTALAIAALLLSQTRMALFATGAGFLVVAILEPRARRWSVPAAAVVAIAAAAWELTGGRTLSELFRYDPGSPDQARWSLWSAACRMFRDHPLVGVGPGGYRRAFPAYHPGWLDNESAWGSAHNQYLHVAAERGLLGAAALAATLGTLWLRAVRAAGGRSDARSLWAASATTALLVMCVTETAFQSEQFASILLLVWAWGVAPPGGSGNNS